MRKLAVLCTALVALVCASVAIAANEYEVTPAATNGKGKGSSAKPAPKSVKFGFTAQDATGNRASVIKDYSINFQGLRSFAKNFPKCTYAQTNSDPPAAACNKALVGTGVINNAFGASNDTTAKNKCDVKIRLFNIGDGLGLRVDGGPGGTVPGFECPIDLNESIRTKLVKAKVAGKVGTSLRFTVPNNLRHPIPGVDNSVAVVNSTIQGKTRTVKIKGKRRKVSILSSIGCTGKQRTISVTFVSEDGVKKTESRKVKC